MSNVGQKIKAMRLKKGYSQGDLSKLSGVKTCNISRWECGGRNITHKSLERLAAALNTTVSKMLK